MSGHEIAVRGSVTELAQMSVAELTETARMLDLYQEKIEGMSGIVATMRGLVFIVAKERLGHGKFLPWLAEHFKKTRKTSAEDMRVAREFVKCSSEVTFGDLASALADKSREPELDLSNPLVSEVAKWVKGRPRIQLLLEFPASKGGARYGSRKKLTPEAELAEFLADCKENFDSTIMSLDELHDKKLWQANSIPDAHLGAAAELARDFSREAFAFIKLPKRERSSPKLEAVA
jgi:hypothetical protein